MEYVSLHNHTTFCDGSDTMEDFVLYAMEKGAKALGFSGHSHQSYEEDYTMTKESEKAYCAEIDRMNALYGSRIRIYKGIELAFYCDSDITPYEYIIGSVHLVKKGDRYLGVDSCREDQERAIAEIYGGDPYGFVRDYYETVARSGVRDCIDIVGHFDLVTKFNEGYSLFREDIASYLDPAIDALTAILPKDKIFEMNTGAITRGYRTAPYIGSPVLLKYMAEHGARMTINADAHHKEDFLYGFDTCRDILKAAGFTEIWQYNGKDFESVGI